MCFLQVSFSRSVDAPVFLMIHRLVPFLSLDWNGAFYHGGGLKGPARIVEYSMCACVCVLSSVSVSVSRGGQISVYCALCILVG